MVRGNRRGGVGGGVITEREREGSVKGINERGGAQGGRGGKAGGERKDGRVGGARTRKG